MNDNLKKLIKELIVINCQHIENMAETFSTMLITKIELEEQSKDIVEDPIDEEENNMEWVKFPDRNPTEKGIYIAILKGDMPSEMHCYSLEELIDMGHSVFSAWTKLNIPKYED